ncbi:23 kDa integral membrane protein-like [Zophobas morio]|uniref:23 kDa integral membrane protein-like n=1 Tax=Zophobas morio TaxID=2755281 RepID=UPI003083C7E1
MCRNFGTVRVLLFVFNFVFLILAIFTITLSASLLTITNRIDLHLSSHWVFSMVNGCIFLCLCLFGFLALFMQRIWILKTFIFLVSVMSTIHFVLAIVSYSSACSMDEDNTKNAIVHIFESQEQAHKNHVDLIQTQVKCCGLEGIESWGNNIPSSCCDQDVCTPSNSYKDGCSAKLFKGYRKMNIILAIVAFVTATEACALIVAVYFATKFAMRRTEAAFLNTAVL